jgi:phosphohistidine phosphatase
MFELLLMRHAKSDWHGHLDDIDRPLNLRGVGDAVKMGSYLNEQGLVPGCMIVSSARRTRETAELLLDSMAVPESHIIIDKELYLADVETLLETIEVYATDNHRLLILAHNPGMDYLVSHLCCTPPELSVSSKLMATCTVAHFQVDSLDAIKAPGQATLINIFRPKEIF